MRSQHAAATNDAAVTARRGPHRAPATAARALRCRRKFLRVFPGGFRDPTYLAWERDYKWSAHTRWEEVLGRPAFASLLKAREFSAIATHAVRIESRTNLLFSFEKIALRDAVRTPHGARVFAEALYAYLHGAGDAERRFVDWRDAVATLPKKQTRVLTWPLLTVFGFIAQPSEHMFLKPNVTRVAAERYGVDFRYRSNPSWDTYASLLRFAAIVRKDIRDLRPRDMIDLQSFIWVQGSAEYDE